MWDTITSIVYIPWIFTTPYVPSVHCSNLSNISTPDKLLFPLPSAHHFLLSWPSVNIKTSIRWFPVVSLSSLAPRGSNSLLSITECSSPIALLMQDPQGTQRGLRWKLLSSCPKCPHGHGSSCTELAHWILSPSRFLGSVAYSFPHWDLGSLHFISV